MNSLSLLKKRNYITTKKKDEGEKNYLVYVLPQEVREKLVRVLSLTKIPDFALILGGKLEKGSKRIFNESATRYILFSWENGIPRMIPYETEKNQKGYRRTSSRNFWDTPNGLLKKK